MLVLKSENKCIDALIYVWFLNTKKQLLDIVSTETTGIKVTQQKRWHLYSNLLLQN